MAYLDALNVRRPTAIGDVMRVADIVPEDRGFGADITLPSHTSYLPMKR